jgi:hypothetical protein
MGFRGCQLDVHGLVAPQAMDQRDKEAVQGRILAGQQPSGVGRLFAFEHRGAGPYRWRRRFATRRGRARTSGLLRMRLSFHAVSQVRK